VKVEGGQGERSYAHTGVCQTIPGGNMGRHGSVSMGHVGGDLRHSCPCLLRSAQLKQVTFSCACYQNCLCSIINVNFAICRIIYFLFSRLKLNCGMDLNIFGLITGLGGMDANCYQAPCNMVHIEPFACK
jgi:hypothetical protein